MPESDAFQVLYDLLAQLEALWDEGRATIARCDARVWRAVEERDDYIARFEREQREHETTKGYRAHAEAQLAACRRGDGT